MPARLVTLVGPPGVGKTRLAIEVAHEVKDAFPDGAWFVALAPVTDPQAALTTILQALEAQPAPGLPPLDALKRHLRERELLLVLDNLEQVLDVAPLIAEVLSVAPKLRVLATSREPLRIAAEQRYSVLPLMGEPAMALFVQRARAMQPDFAPTPDVEAICAKLDGLPLAIELAAARVDAFTPKELLVRLDKRLSTLTSGGRDMPGRQRTLRTTIAWSYQLLTPDEQAFFRRMGVFVGGFTLHAAQTFCEIDGLPLTGEDGIAALLSKYLLTRELQPNGSSRYRMLETIREYALDRLEAQGEFDTWMERLALYLEALSTSENRPQLTPPEADNWRAAMTWLQHTPDSAELGLKLVGLTGQFVRNQEAALWIERILAHPQTVTLPLARAEALFVLGFIQRIVGDLKQARSHLEQCLALCREHNFLSFMDGVLAELGVTAREEGDVERARGYLLEGLAVANDLGHD